MYQHRLEPSKIEWKSDEHSWAKPSSFVFYLPKNIHHVFNSFEVNPKSWSTFNERGRYPQQHLSATIHFGFQLGKQWASIIFSYLDVFSAFQIAILFNWNCEFWANKTNLSASRYDKSINFFFVVWQVSWGKCILRISWVMEVQRKLPNHLR